MTTIERFRDVPNEIGNKIAEKLSPTHGCSNCWGDLHVGCDEKCKAEREEWMKIKKAAVEIVRSELLAERESIAVGLEGRKLTFNCPHLGWKCNCEDTKAIEAFNAGIQAAQDYIRKV